MFLPLRSSEFLCALCGLSPCPLCVTNPQIRCEPRRNVTFRGSTREYMVCPRLVAAPPRYVKSLLAVWRKMAQGSMFYRSARQAKQLSKFGDRKLLGARVKRQSRLAQDLFSAISEPRTQIVTQVFSFVREAFLHKIKESVFIANVERFAGPRHAQTHQR